GAIGAARRVRERAAGRVPGARRGTAAAPLSGLLVFVAVLGAPIVHAPVLALDLLQGLKRPLDGGATIGGRRLFGDNKTWRGAIFMAAGPALAALVLTRWPAYRDALPDAVGDARPLLWGALVGL